MRDKYFSWTLWRLGYASDSPWHYMRLEDDTCWFRIGLGLYWRVS